VTDQVPHTNKTTGKIIVLCMLICILLDSKLGEKDSAPKNRKHSLI
jgi:hypothetical protein